jgi:hypothetical protein
VQRFGFVRIFVSARKARAILHRGAACIYDQEPDDVTHDGCEHDECRHYVLNDGGC